MNATEINQAAFALRCKFHVWQMNDGYWHISPYTNAKVPSYWNSEIDHGFETAAEAQTALKNWAAKEVGA